jgi:hypothetical protein
MALTQRELGCAEELIKAETLCGQKLLAWRDEIRDPELRRLAEELIQGCRRNADVLLNEMRA